MKLLIAFAAAAILTAPAVSAPCRDAKGKFIKCAPAAAATARCKDSKGRFAKCSAVVRPLGQSGKKGG